MTTRYFKDVFPEAVLVKQESWDKVRTARRMYNVGLLWRDVDHRCGTIPRAHDRLAHAMISPIEDYLAFGDPSEREQEQRWRLQRHIESLLDTPSLMRAQLAAHHWSFKALRDRKLNWRRGKRIR